MSSPRLPKFVIIDRSQLESTDHLFVHDCEDCACPLPIETQAETSYALPERTNGKWEQAPGLRFYELKSNHQAVFNPTGDGRVIVINGATRRILDAFTHPVSTTSVLQQYDGNRAAKRAISRLCSLGFLIPQGHVQQPAFRENLILTAWLHVSNQCNLRCTYCFIQKSNDHMSLEKGKAAVDAIIRSAIAEGYEAIKLKYAGGEASLRPDIVFDIHDYAIRHCQRHELALHAVLLTNGARLKDDLVDGLKERRIKVMVSLDGLGQQHDVQRPFRGGQGSALAVRQTIGRLIDAGWPPHLSITVSGHNCDSLDEVIRYALEQNLTFSINFFRENEHMLSDTDLHYTEERIVAGLERAFQVIEEQLPRWSVVGAILDRGQLVSPQRHSCSAGHDYMVVDHKGRISKCHMLLDNSVADISHTHPLNVIRSSQNGLQNLPSDSREGCRTCTWRYYCAGGCPVATFNTYGRYDVRSPNCGIYKAIYPLAVRLEGLRLLQYGKDNPKH